MNDFNEKQGQLTQDEPEPASEESSSVPAKDEEAQKPKSGNNLVDQTNYVPVRKIISIFLSCATISTTGLLDETMVAVALPTISTELGGGNQISWVATAFFITSTACQLLYGRLSDIWSRKTVLFTLFFIFFIGNLASALATSFIQLLVFRGITGVGGGGLPTIGQVIVSDTVSLRDRGKYQGILGLSVAFANGVGPLIGGAFAQKSTWRWIFRMILPLSAFSAICVYLFMPLKPVEGDWKVKLRRVDFVGSFLILGSATLLVMGLTWGGAQYPWDSTHVLATLILGGGLFIAFIIWEGAFPKYPLLPLHIFRNKVVVGAASTQFINGFLTMGQVFYLPAFYQIVYGYSPVKSATLLLPLTVLQTFVSTMSGILVTWTGRYRELILSGWMVWAVGLGLIASLRPNSSIGRQIGYSLFTGFGVGQTLQPSLVAIQGAVERKEMASVTAMRSFSRNLGGTLGLAITGTIVNNVLVARLRQLDLDESTFSAIKQDPIQARQKITDPAILDSVIDGYRRGFFIVFVIYASLASLAFVIAFLLLRHQSLDRSDDARLKEEARKRLADGSKDPSR